jgi:polysaccharide chain length determinant protein (PEP-CTERM system associated)
MTRKMPSNVQDIKDFLIRRVRWILGALLIVPPLVFVAGHFWPKQYRSETMILVDPQSVPEEYVKATVTGDISDRLQTIKEEVMSRTRLLTIAKKNNLYANKNGKLPVESKLLEAMRKDISVDIISGATLKNPIDGFKIAYIAPTPELAQTVTREVADLFIEENLQERDQDAKATEHFIESQVQEARAELQAQDGKIRDFKAAHLGILPEQENANLAMISQYQGLAQQNSEAIDRANQQKVYLQTMLNVSGDPKQARGLSAPTSLQLQLQTDKDQLVALRQKYTDSYPDIVRLREEIARLTEDVKNQPAETSRVAMPGGPNTEQQLEGQLRSTEEEIKSRTERQGQVNSKISSLQSKIENLPAVQQEYESLSRDYSEMQKNYESLLDKEQSSEMAADLEMRNQSEHFRVLDPANYPSVPYSPSQIIVDLCGLAGALLIGLGLAVAAEVRDQTIHTVDEMDSYLDIPVIIALPTVKVDKAYFQDRKNNDLSIAL